MKWVKRGLLGLLALALVGSLVRAFLPEPVEVELAPVERGPFEVTITEPGMTRVKDRYVLSAPLGGRLERITLAVPDCIDPTTITEPPQDTSSTQDADTDDDDEG